MCCPHGVEVNESRNVPQADTLYTLILLWDIKNLRARLGNLGTWVDKESRGFKVILFTQWNLVLKVFKGLWAPIKDIIIIEGGRKTLGECLLRRVSEAPDRPSSSFSCVANQGFSIHLWDLKTQTHQWNQKYFPLWHRQKVVIHRRYLKR